MESSVFSVEEARCSDSAGQALPSAHFGGQPENRIQTARRFAPIDHQRQPTGLRRLHHRRARPVTHIEVIWRLFFEELRAHPNNLKASQQKQKKLSRIEKTFRYRNPPS